MGNLELSQCTLGKNPTFSLTSNFSILKKMKTFGVIFTFVDVCEIKRDLS